MIILAVLTAVYLFFGGYFATALSDFIQGIVMIVGVIVMVFCFLNHQNVNWDLSKLTSDPNLNWFTFNSTKTGIYGNTMSLLSLIFLTSFGVWALPQTVHKFHTVRDKKAINQGMIVSTIFALIIGFVAYFVGALSGLFPEISSVSGDKIIPNMLILVIPTGVMGIIAVLILSASMSTLSSVSLASASVVAVDLYKGKINTNADDNKVNWVMRILCLVFVLISVVLAILNEKFKLTAIAYLMGLSWGTLAGCFIGPFVLGLLSKKITKAGVWASIISSLVLTVVLIFILGYFHPDCTGSFASIIKNGVACSPLTGIICMASSLIVTFVVSLFTKKPSEEILQNAFDKKIENEII
jgi:SSS family solute:Na+ symporter/sodium/proline symporter